MNDIALLQLGRPATLNDWVQPITLPASCASAGTMVSWKITFFVFQQEL